MENKEKNPSPGPEPMDTPVTSAELQDLYRRITPEMKREKPSPDAVAAAMQAVQRLAAEVDAEDAAEDEARDRVTSTKTVACRTCGYQNREGNKFCGMCGITLDEPQKAISAGVGLSEPRPPAALSLPAAERKS